MASNMLINALSITNGYLVENYSDSELNVIREEIRTIVAENAEIIETYKNRYSYDEVQELLSNINEKEDIRKAKGVYYTPIDIVMFILVNSTKMTFDKLKPDNIKNLTLNEIPYDIFCFGKEVYDPTCGAGVFLLAALEIKLDLLHLHQYEVTKKVIKNIIFTLKGNDLNPDSIIITKLRLLLCILHRYGVSNIIGLAKIMDECFTSYDFVSTKPNVKKKYDIIIGNPPYVEDSKSESMPRKKYGNIYANVLDNAAKHLKHGGVMGFIIPLSYVSTPRMKKIREDLSFQITEQYIMSYSDRPDCLFNSVHQKLCVVFGRNANAEKKIYTGNYRYWYKEERSGLFNTTEVVDNKYIEDDFIPKLGNDYDVSVYKKLSSNKTKLLSLLINDKEDAFVYLNMRAAFWIKAFLTTHSGSEYKKFKCLNKDYANFCMCLLNSSLFWWYWVCVSDCWHITQID